MIDLVFKCDQLKFLELLIENNSEEEIAIKLLIGIERWILTGVSRISLSKEEELWERRGGDLLEMVSRRRFAGNGIQL